MNLQDILKLYDIDLTKTKIIRHNLSSDIIRENYNNNNLEIYQSIQSESLFKKCKTLISFIGENEREATLYGCYQINGFKQINDINLYKNISFYDPTLTNCVFWDLERTELLNDLTNRLVIDWNSRTFCQSASNKKEILYIKPRTSSIAFNSYDKTILTFSQLNEIINNPKIHHEWKTKLSSVAGIYLITDLKTGKLYVGSASSETDGIWGRWSEYIKTKHGGNKKLCELIEHDKNYCDNFQFSILEVFPIKRDKHDILAYEQLYKNKLKTIKFGLNDN